MKKKYLLIVSALTLGALFGCNSSEKEVTIIFTNDTHGEINGKLSFAVAGQMKKDLKDAGKNVLLLDSGDTISGGFYTTYDKGKCMVSLMNDAGYDATTLGNHEFDYKFDHLNEIIKSANFPFISTNFYHMKDGVATTRFTDLGSKIFNFNNISIGVIGISTPDSISTSIPSHFMDEEKKNYIYTFMDDKIYETAQKEIDNIRNKCDYVICLSHLGDDPNGNYSSSKLVKNTSGIDVVLDGHTHLSVIGDKVKDKNGKEVLITQAGGKFARIGRLTINKTKGIKNELISESININETIKNKEKNIIKELDDRLSTKIADNTVNFKRLDGVEYGLGDLCAEASYYYYNNLIHKEEKDVHADVTFVNTGGVRCDVNEGDWTLRTSKNIHPFENGVALVKMKGSLLKTALEFSSYKMPNYFGGLQQTCGVKYNVHTNIESDIEVDKNGNYVKGPSKEHERVTDVKIFNRDTRKYEDLDLKKEYYVGGSAYVIINGGDGCSMFKDATPIRQESDVVDDNVLSLYIKSFKVENGEYPVIKSENSPLVVMYGNALEINYKDTGKRINIVSE